MQRAAKSAGDVRYSNGLPTLSMFNNNEPGASHHACVDKQMSSPNFNDAVAEIILSGNIDMLEENGRVLD